jgi:membrane-associated phospholipid phosphatase
MNLPLLVRQYCSPAVQPRVSPVSRSAVLVTFALLMIGGAASLATGFTLESLPNIVLLVVGVVALDVLSQLAPQVRIVEAAQTILYGVLYLMITCVCGVLAAYALQRFAFPLQDRFLAAADITLGLSWLDYAHWVDRHAPIQAALHFAYDSIAVQIALPVIILALSNRLDDLRIYLLGFAIAFIVTIIISALMPAAGPIVSADRAAFGLLRFTGATPIDHLTRLREAGSLVMSDFPGGIATFPSFHSTVAVLTPLALRGYPRILAALLIFNGAMLAGTVTEGAHYFSDVLAGIGMAFFGYCLARYVVRAEDRLFSRTRPVSCSLGEDAAIAGLANR